MPSYDDKIVDIICETSDDVKSQMLYYMASHCVKIACYIIICYIKWCWNYIYYTKGHPVMLKSHMLY